jgi:hypothetical protein
MSSRTTSSPLSHCQLLWLDSILNLEASCCSETSYHNSSNYNLNMLVHLRTVLRRMSRLNRQEITGGGGNFVMWKSMGCFFIWWSSCGIIRLMVLVYSEVLEECTASVFRVTVWITWMLKWSEKGQISSSLPIWLTHSFFQLLQHPRDSDRHPEDGGRFSTETSEYTSATRRVSTKEGHHLIIDCHQSLKTSVTFALHLLLLGLSNEGEWDGPGM